MTYKYMIDNINALIKCGCLTKDEEKTMGEIVKELEKKEKAEKNAIEQISSYAQKLNEKVKENMKLNSILKEGNNKPPLGLMPRWLHDATRMKDIMEACCRYINNYQPIPPEWLSELRDILNAGRY